MCCVVSQSIAKDTHWHQWIYALRAHLFIQLRFVHVSTTAPALCSEAWWQAPLCESFRACHRAGFWGVCACPRKFRQRNLNVLWWSWGKGRRLFSSKMFNRITEEKKMPKCLPAWIQNGAPSNPIEKSDLLGQPVPKTGIAWGPAATGGRFRCNFGNPFQVLYVK